jgi:hypothetical protein
MTKNKPQSHNENINTNTTTTTTTTSQSDLQREMNNVTRHTSDFFNEGQPPRNEPPTSDRGIVTRPTGPVSEEIGTEIPNMALPEPQGLINGMHIPPRLRGPQSHQLLNTTPTRARVPQAQQVDIPQAEPGPLYDRDGIIEILVNVLEERRIRQELRDANIDVYTAIRNNLIRLRLDTNNIIDSIMTFAWNHPIITTGFGLATIGGITWFFFYRTRNLVYATQALVGSNFIENLLTPTDQMPHPNGVARPQTRFSSFVLLGAQAGGALFLIKIIISGLRH